MRSSSIGLAKRASATVVDSPRVCSSSAAPSASCKRPPRESIAIAVPSRTIRPLPISSIFGVSGSGTPTPSPRG